MIYKFVTVAMTLLVCAFSVPAFAGNDTRDVVYNRIIKSNTIRCGYYVYPPFISKDPNTLQLSGFSYDMMEHIGKSMSLKIEWVAEVNFDAVFEGYTSGKYDMVCGPITANPARARASDFTIPFMYVAYYLYAREGDKRFDNQYAKANLKDVTYASLDGEMNEIIGKEDFPLAHKFSIGQNSAGSDLLMAIKAKKADVAALEPVVPMNFMKANPKSIRQVKGDPVRIMPLTYSIPQGEERLKSFLNITIQTLIDTGVFEKTVRNYPDLDATLLRTTKPYEIRK